jgi:hypothetical protein
MSHFDATTARAGAVLSLRPARSVSSGPSRLWRLLAHGAALLMFTLGIYRFWLTTDIRRFLWSNTELAGESFEYAGTARELLLGFLIAITILVPLYTAFFFLAFSAGAIGEMAGSIAFVVLTLLGHYAVYRARRYRLRIRRSPGWRKGIGSTSLRPATRMARACRPGLTSTRRSGSTTTATAGSTSSWAATTRRA